MKYKDNDNNKVMEYVPIVMTSDPPKAILDTITEIKMLEDWYGLHANLKSKFLG